MRPLVSIQSRDLDLLRGLFESRVMSGGHIAAIYFNDRSEMAKKRLQKLAAAGFVARHSNGQLRPQPFVLASHGLAELRKRGILGDYPPIGLSALERRSRVSPHTLAHELEVMDAKAALVRAARHAGVRVLEFTTWPLLNEFADGTGAIVKPDGFLRLETPRPDGAPHDHSFYVEIDRSTETQAVLAKRARAYLSFYRSGGFALRNGGTREEYRRHPFRILYVLKTAERRNNATESLLRGTPPILGHVWLTTLAEMTENPLGAIWITPMDYRDALAGSAFDQFRRRPQWGYKRETRREAFVEKAVPKKTLLAHQ